MNVIVVDAIAWNSQKDFYNSIYGAVGVFADLVYNLNALLDAIVWDHGRPATQKSFIIAQPILLPCTITIVNLSHVSGDVMCELKFFLSSFLRAKKEYRNLFDKEIDIYLKTMI